MNYKHNPNSCIPAACSMADIVTGGEVLSRLEGPAKGRVSDSVKALEDEVARLTCEVSRLRIAEKHYEANKKALATVRELYSASAKRADALSRSLEAMRRRAELAEGKLVGKVTVKAEEDVICRALRVRVNVPLGAEVVIDRDMPENFAGSAFDLLRYITNDVAQSIGAAIALQVMEAAEKDPKVQHLFALKAPRRW